MSEKRTFAKTVDEDVIGFICIITSTASYFVKIIR